MNSKKVKIFTLLFLVTLVVVTFYATSKQQERQENGISTIVNYNGEQNENEKEKVDPKPVVEENIPVEEDVITISEDESTEVLQYKIPNCYVSGKTTNYKLGGYKYFIIRSKAVLNDFLSTRFLFSENDEIISFNTEEIEEKIDEEFFKEGSVIILVYYNQTQKVDGKVVGISVMQDDININLERNNSSKDATNFITYIIPIETRTFEGVKVTFK